jgi:hypothetical protein
MFKFRFIQLKYIITKSEQEITMRLSKQFNIKLQAAIDSCFVVIQHIVMPQQQSPPPTYISEEMQVEENLFYDYEVRVYASLSVDIFFIN